MSGVLYLLSEANFTASRARPCSIYMAAANTNVGSGEVLSRPLKRQRSAVAGSDGGEDATSSSTPSPVKQGLTYW